MFYDHLGFFFQKSEVTMASVTTCSTPHDVMISYNYKYKAIIKDIAKHLRDEGISCWLDEDDMRGHRCLLGAMGDAVDNCKMFLMCYSTEYDLSQNCRLGNIFPFFWLPFWKIFKDAHIVSCQDFFNKYKHYF